jgi:hypothetical protein
LMMRGPSNSPVIIEDRPQGGRQLSVFKPVDLHRRYPQQGRRCGSPWSRTWRCAQGHKTQDLYRFR